MIDKPFIGIADNIGVGKTTFTKILSKRMNLIPYYESVDDNPYQIFIPIWKMEL